MEACDRLVSRRYYWVGAVMIGLLVKVRCLPCRSTVGLERAGSFRLDRHFLNQAPRPPITSTYFVLIIHQTTTSSTPTTPLHHTIYYAHTKATIELLDTLHLSDTRDSKTCNKTKHSSPWPQNESSTRLRPSPKSPSTPLTS